MSVPDYRPQAVDLGAFSKRASSVPAPQPAAPRDEHDERQEHQETGSAQGAVQGANTGSSAPGPRQRRAREEEPEEAIPVVSGPKVQFFVHLPPEEHAWLRHRATAAGTPKREVVIDAFLNHRDELRSHDPDAERRSQAGLPPREPVRRKEVGGIPSNVYISRAEAEVLDKHARAVGMSRSQMVSELLRLASAEPRSGPKPRDRRTPA